MHDDAILEHIEALAQAGQPCPSNAALAEMIGQGVTKDAVMHAIRRLAARNLLRTEVIRARRRIYACRIDRWTKFSVIGCGASGWLLSPDDIQTRKVQRDPCFMCGARGDVGCRHRKA